MKQGIKYLLLIFLIFFSSYIYAQQVEIKITGISDKAFLSELSGEKIVVIDSVFSDNGVYRIDSTGSIRQSYITGGSIQSSLCISNQTGLMYVGSTNGDVFIMRDPGIGGKKSSKASYEWPTFKGNNQRSKVVRLVSNATFVQDEKNVIVDYSLFQNYPNPFNPSTIINFEIPVQTNVLIKVYDLLGNEISTLINEEKPVGNYKVEFDASSLSNGVYFYRLQAGNFMQTRKMVLTK